MLIIKKRYLDFWLGLKYSLDDRAVERQYFVNFTEQQKKFCLSLQNDGVNNYIFIGVKLYKVELQFHYA